MARAAGVITARCRSTPGMTCTFWYTQEVLDITGLANWRTEIVSFVSLPVCPVPGLSMEW